MIPTPPFRLPPFLLQANQSLSLALQRVNTFFQLKTYRLHSITLSKIFAGIGRAIALSFARSGASKIAITARSSLDSLVDDLKAAALQAGRAEPIVLPLQIDITTQSSVEAAAKKVESEFEELHVLINNAGILRAGKIAEIAADDWWKVWDTHIRGTFLMIQSFLPLMLNKPGGDKTIVTVSSVGAHCVMPTVSAYQTSKLAQLRLMEFVCAEYGEQGVVAYSVHPGNVPGTVSSFLLLRFCPMNWCFFAQWSKV